MDDYEAEHGAMLRDIGEKHKAQQTVQKLTREIEQVLAENARLNAIINNPELLDFAKGVRLEAAHQVERWGHAHDRSKSAENWFWLVGYLAGKCLRACITGDRDKAMHHTISAAAALANWHESIKHDQSGAGIGTDMDIKPNSEGGNAGEPPAARGAA